MKKKIILVCSLLILIPIAIIGLNVYGYYHYTGELVGIKGTSTYHRDNCQFVKKAASTQLIFLGNLDKTAELDYRPCTSCNPPDNTVILQSFIDKQAKIKADSDKQFNLDIKNARDKLNDLSKLEVTGTNSEIDYGGGYVVTCTVKKLILYKAGGKPEKALMIIMLPISFCTNGI